MNEIVQFENVGLRYGAGAETLADLNFTLFPGSFGTLHEPYHCKQRGNVVPCEAHH